MGCSLQRHYWGFKGKGLRFLQTISRKFSNHDSRRSGLVPERDFTLGSVNVHKLARGLEVLHRRWKLINWLILVFGLEISFLVKYF
jgi:hypothetical protein